LTLSDKRLVGHVGREIDRKRRVGAAAADHRRDATASAKSLNGTAAAAAAAHATLPIGIRKKLRLDGLNIAFTAGRKPLDSSALCFYPG
jgi:hypothetical protein